MEMAKNKLEKPFGDLEMGKNKWKKAFGDLEMGKNVLGFRY